MSRGQRPDLPVHLGHHLRKGLLASQNDKMGGYDLAVVWLDRTYETGQKYKLEDVDGVNVVLHFCDISSVEQTIKVLRWILRRWKERDNVGEA